MCANTPIAWRRSTAAARVLDGIQEPPDTSQSAIRAFLLAMIDWQQGRRDEARQRFVQGRQYLAQCKETPASGFWPRRLRDEALARSAPRWRRPEDNGVEDFDPADGSIRLREPPTQLCISLASMPDPIDPATAREGDQLVRVLRDGQPLGKEAELTVGAIPKRDGLRARRT